MGLFFRSRRKRRGPGLFGLLLMIGVCFFGLSLLVGNSASVFTSCQNLTRSFGNSGQNLCVGMQQAMASIYNLSGTVQGMFGNVQQAASRDWVPAANIASVKERWQSLTQRLDTGANWQGGQGASSLVSMDAVKDMLRTGHYQGGLDSSSGRLQNAFGSFMAGQSLAQSGGDLESQLAWYRNGAGMGEYGILSQLKLGSLYMSGAEGVAPDYGLAYDYNMQALGSLQQLQSSTSPEAMATLGALPVEPSQLQLQLQESLRQLQLQQ